MTAAAERSVGLQGVAPFRFMPGGGPPGLLLGYAPLPEDAIRRGVVELAAAARTL